MKGLNRVWRAWRQQQSDFSARLMRLYLALLLIPLLGVGLYGHAYMAQALRAFAERDASTTTRAISATVDALLENLHSDVHALRQHLQADPNDPAPLSILAASHPLYQHIAWLQPDTNERLGQWSAELNPWLRDPAFADVNALPPESLRFVPLLPADDAPLALIVAAPALDGLLLLELNTEFLLRKSAGDADAERLAFLIGSDAILTRGEAMRPLVNLNAEQIARDAATIQLAEQTYRYQRLGPGHTWTLFWHMPASPFAADLLDYDMTFMILLLGSMVTAVGLALLAIAHLTEPVHQLSRMVDDVRRGLPRARLPWKMPGGELGKLMSAFDQMALELRQTQAAEKALIEQLIKAQEEERKYLAYDLHDGLIQHLVGARLYLGQCRQRCGAPQNGSGKGHNIRLGYDVLTEAIAEGRRIIQGLHPTVLDDMGLAPALREMGENMATTSGWQLQVELQPLPQAPDRITCVTLYRIAQEALSNVHKHAQAQHVWLSLKIVNDKLLLTVRDDGQGFDPRLNTGEAGQSWGLTTMRERARLLHGHYELTSHPGEGTLVRVTVPLTFIHANLSAPELESVMP